MVDFTEKFWAWTRFLLLFHTVGLVAKILWKSTMISRHFCVLCGKMKNLLSPLKYSFTKFLHKKCESECPILWKDEKFTATQVFMSNQFTVNFFWQNIDFTKFLRQNRSSKVSKTCPNYHTCFQLTNLLCNVVLRKFLSNCHLD